MSLSCSCDYDDYEFEAGDWTYWYYIDQIDFEKLGTTKRKRCCSCNELIDINSLCLKFQRFRYPYNDIESKIKTGLDLEDSFCDKPSIPIVDHYHCERCGEIWLNLSDVGYECLVPSENMVESLKEYQGLIGFKKS